MALLNNVFSKKGDGEPIPGKSKSSKSKKTSKKKAVVKKPVTKKKNKVAKLLIASQRLRQQKRERLRKLLPNLKLLKNIFLKRWIPIIRISLIKLFIFYPILARLFPIKTLLIPN